jgi:hypothetical protein
VYGRKIADRELTFGVSGKLHANSLIMYDHQTDSLWSHLAGAAVTGPLKDQKLSALPSMLTQWGTWKSLHPDSKVLVTGQSSVMGSLKDPYETYYRSSDTGIIPPRLLDKRIYPKEFVLGLVLNARAKAYPFSVLSKKPVINDAFEGLPLLIVFDEQTTSGMIFSRRLDKVDLTFSRKLPSTKSFVLTDNVSRSEWQALSGKAIGGPMKGKKLVALPFTPSFWFGWVDHYPKTELFGINR